MPVSALSERPPGAARRQSIAGDRELTVEAIRKAENEARRFIAAANKAVERIKSESTVAWSGCKETGACRRASLDLTRALADMRSRER